MNYGLLFLTFLILILTSSAISKLFALKSFKNTIQLIGIPNYFSLYISVVIPIIEILIVFLLISEVTLYFGLVSILTLSFIFFAVSLYSMKLDKEIKCNCFGNLTNEKLGLKTFTHILLLVIPTIILLKTKINLLTFPIFEILDALFLNIGVFIIYLVINEMRIFIKSIRLFGALRRQYDV